MRRIWFFAIFVVLLGVVWAQIETPDLKVPDLPDAPKKIINVPIDTFLSTPNLLSTERRFINVPTDTFLQVPRLPETSSRDFEAPQMASLEIPGLPTIELQTFKAPEDIPLDLPNLPGTVWEDVRKISDLRGGLDLVSAKTKVAPNCAVELINVLWNPQGEMYKRPGYSEHSTPPFIPNFLYAYYKQTGEKYTMGGSDTALYFWHEDSSGDGWTYLTGTEGTEGRWDGTTFEDVFVGTHEGIVPVVWNGSTMITMGTSADSFRARETHSYTNTAAVCSTGSTWIKFDEADAGWTTNEWEGYILLFQARIDTATGPIKDTVTQKAIILSNTANTMIIRHDTYRGIAGTVMPVIPDYTNNWYTKILSWFQVDTVWREGKVDSVKNPCSTAPFTTQIFDCSYTWDSTFSYNDYIFEVTSGTGDEKRVFLYDWNYGASSDCGQWNDSAFFVSTFSPTCFDTSTYYRIYKPSFWEGSKFVETFDGSLWLGWTGTGDEQEKNVVVYSETDDLGNWPSGNHIIIESDDGDFITGMAKFPGEYTDVPRQEMIVTKNNSLYKIVPSGDDYAFWLITRGVGCVSNSAISPAEGLLLFPDQHGVWAYDKIKPTCISLKIKPIFEGWNLEYLENVSAIYGPQKRTYYLSYPGTEGIYQGQFIVSYDVDTSGCDPCGIYTNIVDTDGSKLGEHNDIVGGNKYNDIAVKNDGAYVIVWRSQTGGSTGEIWLRKFEVDGTAVGDSIQLNDVADSCTLYWPTVDMNKDGNIVACWEDFRDGGSGGGEGDIYCQCLTWGGGKSGSNFVVNATHAANAIDAKYPDVAMNDGGFFVVTWTDSTNHIYAQKYTSCGNADGSNFSVKFDDQNQYSAVAVGGDNQFVVAYRSTEGASTKDIWMRFYASDGTVGDSMLVNTADAGRNFQRADVAMNASGKFVVVWQKDSSASIDQNIYARKYDSDGTASGSEFMVNTELVGEVDVDQYPAVAINDNDDFLIVWDEDKNANRDIYGRLYTWSAAVDIPFPINDDTVAEEAQWPKVAIVSGRVGAATHAIAWSFDHHGWSRETVVASAYAYQHSLSDTVKIIFADTDKPKVYDYATQADDIDDPVILTYHSPFFEFTEHPSFVTELEYFTLEASLDSGSIYLTSYRDYSELISEDTIQCGGDCRHELTLPDVLGGKNISVKIITGTEIDTFYLSGYTIETITEKSRK